MKTPNERTRQKYRRDLLRNPPRFPRNHSSHFAAAVILGELALIHNNPRLTGDTKHELFVRGAKQISELPQ